MRIVNVIRVLGGSVTVYFVVAACSGSSSVSSASANDDANGTRLKVQRYVGSDGSSFTAGLYDSQLGVPCSCGTASDGSTRCLPIGGAFESILGNYFADSACKMPVVFPGGSAGTECSVAKYTLVTLSCGSDVYQPTVHTGPLFTQQGTSGCVPAPSSGTMGKTPYVMGNPLPPSTFVAGTLTTDS